MLTLASDVARAAVRRQFEDLIADARERARAALPYEAWGLPIPDEPEHAAALTRRNVAAPHGPCPRVPYHRIEIVVSDAAPATPAALLLEPDADIRGFAAGTRSALQGGAARACKLVRSQWDKPGGLLRGFGAQLWAAPDVDGRLAQCECYIVLADGSQYCGDVVVWRYPLHVALDVQLWKAVPLPAGAAIAWRNTITCATEVGARALAHGDYDGDVINVTADERVVQLVRATAASARAWPWGEAEAAVRLALRTPGEPWADGELRAEQLRRTQAAM
eukprot:15465758-Alexandrium_andersonii.AAC.1